MAVHKLERTQYINAPIEQVWRFFSDPRNLAVITPSYMKFLITSKELPGEILPGQIITYKVSPLLGIPLSWTTEITEVERHKYFVDEQKAGPYKLWRHKHYFKEEGNRVLMTDVVEYEMPFMVLGAIAHLLFVKRQLAGIFDFRYKKVEELFNR